MGRKTTGTVWFSQFIRKVWNLQHDMWRDRNAVLHKDGKSLHQLEAEALDRVVQEEFIIGRNSLSFDYIGLFRQNLDMLLEEDTNFKMQWLYSVWAGRDRLSREQGLEPWYKDPLAAMFITRYHKRRKRNKRVDQGWIKVITTLTF